MESNPYFEARREWDERYADLVLGKRNWQIAAERSRFLGRIGSAVIASLGSSHQPFILVDLLRMASAKCLRLR